MSIAHSKATKVLIINSKGGVGKSTIVSGLISKLIREGRKVEHIDFDPQGSSYHWASDILTLDSQKYNPSLKSLSHISSTLKVQRDSEYLIMDSPSNFSNEDMVRYCFFSDIIIIPLAPSPVDLHATLPLIESIIMSKPFRQKKMALSFIINRCLDNDERLCRVSNILSNFREHKVIGRLNESLKYQDIFSEKKLICNNQDISSWENIYRFLENVKSTEYK